LDCSIFLKGLAEAPAISYAITNGSIFDGERLYKDCAVLISGTRIEAVVSAADIPTDVQEIYDLEGGNLIPGFVDLQVNGGGGVLFNAAPTLETLRTIGAAHRRYGTTGFLPTLISDSYEVMRSAAKTVRRAIEEETPGVLGIHFEGPFLNPGRGGAHDAGRFRHLDEEGFDILTSLGVGRTLVTLAPELTESATIRRLVESGVIVSAGHSEATYAETRAALAAGLSGFTHLYNAMTPMTSREPGMVGAALEDGASWFGIIADGHHVHPAAIRVAVTAKRTGGALLVTDAMPTVGSDMATFELHGATITARGGRLTNAEGRLAGSDLDMRSAVDNAAGFAGIDWHEAVRMATVYPARAIRLEGELGMIRPGFRADLQALDANRRIRATWIGGLRESVPPTRSR